MDCVWKRPKSRKLRGCSSSRPSHRRPRCAQSSWLMQGMEARDPHPMSPTKISFVPPKPSAPRLSAKRYAKKTRTRPAHSPGSPGLLLASADGTAITSHPVPRPCERVGTNVRPWHSVMPLQWLAKIRESRRPEGRGFLGVKIKQLSKPPEGQAVKTFLALLSP